VLTLVLPFNSHSAICGRIQDSDCNFG
jgi:hypothetical protein